MTKPEATVFSAPLLSKVSCGVLRQRKVRWGAVGRRVPPFQGGEGLIGPGSQGVALGWRVVAPLARGNLARQRRRAIEQQAVRRGVIREQAIREQIRSRARSLTRQRRATHQPGATPQEPTIKTLPSPERAEPGARIGSNNRITLIDIFLGLWSCSIRGLPICVEYPWSVCHIMVRGNHGQKMCADYGGPANVAGHHRPR
jgi:hypothetical protein